MWYLIQAAGEYAAAAGQSANGTAGGTRIEGLDRLLSALQTAWETTSTFALEHPVLAITLGLLLGLLAERLLMRGSWRF